MTALKYVGGGAWIPGVPARDLSAKEAAKYADEIGQYEAGLYVPAGKAQPQPKADDLASIKGVGAQIITALKENGITTFRELIEADPVELDQHLDGSSEKQIRNWQFQALQLQES